jgi:hypothetical protein
MKRFPFIFSSLLAIVLVATIHAAPFSVVLSANDTLKVLNEKGDAVAELNSPTLGKVVSVPPASVQMSFGRDAMDRLTLIVSPDPKNLQSISFSVLGRTVDLARDSVVSLSFSNNGKSLTLDPGFVGLVKVDGRSVGQMVAMGLPSEPVSNSTSSTSANSGTTITPPPVAEVPASVVDTMPVSSTPNRKPVQVTTNTPASTSSEGASVEIRQLNPGSPVSSPASPVTNSSPVVEKTEPRTKPTPVISPTPVPVSSIASTKNEQTPVTVASDASPKLVQVNNPPAAPAPESKRLWNEPVTAPGQGALPVAPNEIKLMEVRGPVQVSLSGSGTDYRNATDGMIVPNGALVKTSDGGTAAVVMGGVDSARLAPNTEAAVSSKVDRSIRDSNVDVKSGTVFARVGRRLGEAQDFKVRSVFGVAAARGTSYAVRVTSKKMVVFGNDGTILVTEPNGLQYKILAPPPGGKPQVAVLPRGSTATQQDYDELNTIILFLNNKTSAILAKPIDQRTADELAYLTALGASETTYFGGPTAGYQLPTISDWVNNPPLPANQSKDPSTTMNGGFTTPFPSPLTP